MREQTIGLALLLRESQELVPRLRGPWSVSHQLHFGKACGLF